MVESQRQSQSWEHAALIRKGNPAGQMPDGVRPLGRLDRLGGLKVKRCRTMTQLTPSASVPCRHHRRLTASPPTAPVGVLMQNAAG
jgi:hypothetical protein